MSSFRGPWRKASPLEPRRKLSRASMRSAKAASLGRPLEVDSEVGRLTSGLARRCRRSSAFPDHQPLSGSTLDIIEQRRQLLAFGLVRRFEVALAAEEARRDDPVEEHLGAAGGEDGVAEFVVPDGPGARLRLGRDQVRLGLDRVEIGDDRRGIGDGEIAVPEAGYLLERARR